MSGGKRNEMLMLQELSQNDRVFFCSSKEFGLSFRMLLLSVVSFFLTFFLAVVAHFDAQREMLGLAT